MGNNSSRVGGRSRQVNVVFLGLEGSGKTSALKNLGEPKQVVATKGCGLVRLTQNGFRINCLDVGGSVAQRSVWKSTFKKVHAIAFVIDATDRRRIEKAGTTLQSLLDDSILANKPLLILCNKSDLWNAVSSSELSDSLNCSQIRGRSWQIQATSAKTGEGLQTAFSWLTRTLAERHMK